MTINKINERMSILYYQMSGRLGFPLKPSLEVKVPSNKHTIFFIVCLAIHLYHLVSVSVMVRNGLYGAKYKGKATTWELVPTKHYGVLRYWAKRSYLQIEQVENPTTRMHIQVVQQSDDRSFQ